ncbi:saccharopine dehydrogenase family protein [Corynebacterium heidelbergense]|uniref:Trans-2-enoyl-CoA reductase n=1 Tax=Corynebacterium heidelbergense TaxID=2055947 RepID=A0A364V459_9CORY|nr:saccharopine dehydrogenase NADP-binding domain-containing protein [Corynebacterium heidelbergense]RAV31424.1 trans-2-enoyl-CoA reductase [Corynebacterium heidelbergense]
MTEPTAAARDYDIVVYGATGFVGALTAKYLAEHAPEGIRIALGGRTKSKLRRVQNDLSEVNPDAAHWGIIAADATDNRALRSLAESTTVVISTVGPYAKYGKQLVAECAAAGTHYVDLCGEVLFNRYTIDHHHEQARQTGARIIHACGFDSVPSDIGMFLLHRAAAEKGVGPLAEATMLVKMKGGLSGGTVDSMRGQIATMRHDKGAAKLLQDPYSLSPDRESEPDLGKQPDYGLAKAQDFGAPDGHAAPFLMAGANTRVVRRSNALLDHAYGKNLRYREFISTGPGLKGKATAAGLAAGTGALFGALRQDNLRGVLKKWLPEPGQGPSEEDREQGFFRCDFYGRSTPGAGVDVTARVAAEGDPGYKATCLMLAEAALTLALGQDGQSPEESSQQGPAGGGVLTPATGLGMPYVRRLRDAGMTLTARAL